VLRQYGQYYEKPAKREQFADDKTHVDPVAAESAVTTSAGPVTSGDVAWDDKRTGWREKAMQTAPTVPQLGREGGGSLEVRVRCKYHEFFGFAITAKGSSESFPRGACESTAAKDGTAEQRTTGEPDG
jgi:hypothetical protein